MKREELVVKPYTLCYEGCYHKTEADSVMDAMERRITRLTALAEGRKRKSIGIENYYHNKLKRDKARIKELELAFSKSSKHEKIFSECFDKHIQRIKELEATISKKETTQKWISVKDRLPEENKKVLVSNPSAHTSKIAWKYRGHWFFDTNCDILVPTHWTPLPSTTEEK